MSCEFFKLAETHASNRKLLRAALYKNIRLKGISKEFNFTTKYHERRSCNKVVTTHQELHLVYFAIGLCIGNISVLLLICIFLSIFDDAVDWIVIKLIASLM